MGNVNSLTAVFALLIVAGLAIVLTSTVLGESEQLRTDDASEALACMTGAGETTCDLSLADPHAYSTSEWLTVRETSPGSGTHPASPAVGDPSTVTVSGLTENTSYAFAVDYRVVDATFSVSNMDAILENASVFWAVVPVLAFIFVILVAFNR
jgi:hypothetical protein